MFSDFNDFFFDDLLGANEETKTATAKWLDSILQNDSGVDRGSKVETDDDKWLDSIIQNDSGINWNSKEEVLELVEGDGNMLRFASAELQNDKEVVLAAVRGGGLKYASEKLQQDKDVVALHSFEHNKLTYEEMLKEMDLTDEIVASVAYAVCDVVLVLESDKEKVIEKRKALFKAEYEKQMKEKELKKKDPEEPGDSGPSNG